MRLWSFTQYHKATSKGVMPFVYFLLLPMKTIHIVAALASRFTPTPAAALHSRLASACCPDLQCVFALTSFGRLRADQAWNFLTHFAGSSPYPSYAPSKNEIDALLGVISFLAEDTGLSFQEPLV